MSRLQSLVLAVAVLVSSAASAAVYNVRSYGAAGDGSTDDTTSIQNALNAVPAEGGEVYVPAGSYKITNTLKIKSKTRFRGEGMRSSRIFWGTTTDLDLIENSDTQNGNDGITIEDLEIDGNRASNYTTNVLYGLGIELTNVTNFHVERCYVHDVVRDAVEVTGSASSTGFITNNRMTSNGRTVSWTVGGDAHSVTEGAGVGIIMGTDIVVANNIIVGNNGVGVHCEKNNAAETLKEISITDNVIRNNVGGGVYVVGKPTNGEAEHVSITGNTIENVGEGIRIEYGRWYLIGNNRITGTVRHGIRILGAVSIDGTITGNHIYDVGSGNSERDGINIDSTQSRISVTGNNIQGVMSRMDRAIQAPNATDLLIVGNIARGGTSATLINAPASSNVVASNKVN